MSGNLDAAIADAQHIIETAGDGDDIARDQAAQFLSRPEIVRRIETNFNEAPTTEPAPPWIGQSLWCIGYAAFFVLLFCADAAQAMKLGYRENLTMLSEHRFPPAQPHCPPEAHCWRTNGVSIISNIAARTPGPEWLCETRPAETLTGATVFVRTCERKDFP